MSPDRTHQGSSRARGSRNALQTGCARYTSWSAPKCAAFRSSEGSQPPRPSASAGGAELRGRAPTNPPLLGGPSRHSSASVLCVCQRGSSDSLPFLGVYRFSSRHTKKEGRPVRTRLRAQPWQDNFLMGSETPRSACSSICRSQTQAWVGEARPIPGLGGTDPGQRVSGCARAVQL